MHEAMNTKPSIRNLVGRRYRHTFRNRQKGALLIGLIITMVILSALGGGMVHIFSSSTLNPISGNYAQRAYYNAEAGFRYVTALYRVAGDKTVLNPYINSPQTITLPDGGTAVVSVTLPTTTATATAAVSGYNLVLSGISGTFPTAPGFFTKNGIATVYRYTGINSVTVSGITTTTLTGIFPTGITSGAITTKEQTTITSQGKFGGGFVSRTVKYTWPLSASSGGNEPTTEFDPEDFTGGQKPDYKVTPISAKDFQLTKGKSSVTTDTYAHPQGGTYERTDLIVSGYDTLGSGNSEVRYHYVPFKNNSANLGMYQAWNLNNQLLSYDVQVKMATTPLVNYASMGFMFRTVVQGSGQNVYYTGYGISFMRYEDLVNSDNDYIPSALKPSLANGNSQSNRLLLVLWEQTGQTTWRWLAYKKLHLLSPGSGWGGDTWNRRTSSEVYDDWVRGSQYGGDGYFIHDDSTLMIRVIEKMVGGIRTNDIQLFFGDARWSSNNQNGRTQDTNAYNVMANRFGYEQRFSLSAGVPLWKWPSLPDISATNWSPTENDWFTAVTWDRVNTASGVTALLIADKAGQYSIVRDGNHTSEGFTNNHTKIPELVFHTFGDLDSDRTIHFRDFGVRLLKGGGSGAGSPWIGPIQE